MQVKQWLIISFMDYFEMCTHKQNCIISLVCHFGIYAHQAIISYLSCWLFWKCVHIKQWLVISLAGQAVVNYLFCGLFWNVYTSSKGVLYLLWVILEFVHIKQWLVISLVGYFEMCSYQAMVDCHSCELFWNMHALSNNGCQCYHEVQFWVQTQRGEQSLNDDLDQNQKNRHVWNI